MAMKKIVEGSGKRVGTIYLEVDSNFLAVCNSILRIAYPEYTLKDYAATEPDAPVENDCYLVLEAGEVWGVTCEQDDVLRWDGAAWELLGYKITEINGAIQENYFKAEKIVLTPVPGLTATDLQAAIEEIRTALVMAGIIVVDASGSGV